MTALQHRRDAGCAEFSNISAIAGQRINRAGVTVIGHEAGQILGGFATHGFAGRLEIRERPVVPFHREAIPLDGFERGGEVINGIVRARPRTMASRIGGG